MSRAFEQQITSDIVDAFLDAGEANAGIYTAPGGSPIPCRVMINRAEQPLGTFGSVQADGSTVLLLLSEIPLPVRGAIVVADGDSFKLIKQVRSDSSAALWEVG